MLQEASLRASNCGQEEEEEEEEEEEVEEEEEGVYEYEW